ncbi:hypothetical protein N7520_011933 [Penicillium odoratum]|uniref:uncharacterized protein n=1 Tax=Penicillium odoratum TaxID=1167516 RepID=UPI002546C768|nr:uncharacterized protein N7520_011933 [Penicillium odoratum]KAJ5746751.1 hypothetical protein N7520_011933 [Penicillium odoratum]
MDHGNQEKGRGAGLSRFLKQEIVSRHADLLLFACCLTSGLVDSTIYNGNTIFVGLGASNQNSRPYGWARSLTSIGCFVMGAFFFARLNQWIGAHRRGSLMLSFFIQASLLVITATLVSVGVVSSNMVSNQVQTTIQWDSEIPIALLSFQSAGQIVASRALGYNEIPTVVITSLLCDLMSDPKLFFLRNEKRDRRIVAFILTMVGAIVGGWVTKATAQISPVLWLAAGIKFSVALCWGFWKTRN